MSRLRKLKVTTGSVMRHAVAVYEAIIDLVHAPPRVLNYVHALQVTRA